MAKIKLLSLLFISILISACGKEKSFVDPELQPLFNEFMEVSRSYGHNPKTSNLIVNFGSLSGNKAGACKEVKTLYINGTKTQKEVIVDREFWDGSTTATQEIIMFHELGHCLLGQGHDNNDSIPVSYTDEEGTTWNTFAEPSFMAPSTVQDVEPLLYAVLKPYYLEKMFIGESDLLNVASFSKTEAGYAYYYESSEEDHVGCIHEVVINDKTDEYLP